MQRLWCSALGLFIDVRKVQEGHHFLQTVLKARKLFLIGGERDLRRLAEKGSPPDAP